VAFYPGGLPRRLIQLPLPVARARSARNSRPSKLARRLLRATVMRSRTLLGDVHQDLQKPARPDTYERVRRTLDEALAELQLPVIEREDSAPFKLPHQN
jgi:hypothetical protein